MSTNRSFPARKRNYTKKLACNNCRRSKLKCDRKKPCASCKLRGLQDQCYDGDDDIPHESGSQNVNASNSESPSTLDDVTKTLQKQESAFTSLLAHLQMQGETSSQPHTHQSHWSDKVKQSLPSPQDLEVILEYCSVEHLMFGLPLHQNRLIDTYNRLKQGTIVSRVEAGILLVLLATSSLIIPEMHALRPRLSSSWSPTEDHKVWFGLAFSIKTQDRCEAQEQRATKDTLAEIMLEYAFSSYFSLSEQEDDEWDSLGIAVRKGARISLFDDRHALWRGLNETEKLARRTLAVAIAVEDGWTAFNRMILPGIDLSKLHLDFQESGCQPGVPPFTAGMDPRQLPTLHHCHDFILNFNDKPRPARYSEASHLCEEIEATSRAMLSSMGVTIPPSALSAFIPTLPEIQKVPLLIFASTSSYLACMVTRRFLTDLDAPLSLRFVSLQHAQNILATVPTITSIIQDKKAVLNPAWKANQLLCAATAFAVIVNGRDEYSKIRDDLLYGSTVVPEHATEAAAATSATDSTAPSSAFHIVTEQLQWISVWIFEILDCLQVMYSATNNQTTLLCLRMLQGMCRGDKHLHQTFQQRYPDEIKLPISSHHQDQGPNYSEEVQKFIDLVLASTEEANLFSDLMCI